jgi:ADP-heptose:LPS heptosyltransferase
LRIGLAWAGNPNYRADRERSTELKTFLPLLEIAGVLWVSLQKGDAAVQIAGLPPQTSLYDASSGDRDLADTAALVANLDLVISTDTVIAHLAGAVGKPLWLLLPWQSDWRWMQDRLDTPWYPQARIFRQSSAGDWEELVHRVKTSLLREFPSTHAVANSL